MVDTIKIIVKWLIIALIIFLIIFLLANIINGDSKKKNNQKQTEIKTINNDNYDINIEEDKEEEVKVNNETSVVNSPNTGIKEDLPTWIGLSILSIGGYYIYTKKKKETIKQA